MLHQPPRAVTEIAVTARAQLVDMPIDRDDIRCQILGSPYTQLKRAAELADRIVDDIKRRGLAVGHCLGTMDDLALNYGASRRIIHEASRILELRGATRVQRGARGGVFVTTPSMSLAVDAVVDYCLALGVSDSQIEEAARACDLLRQAGMRENGLLAADPSAAQVRSPSPGHELICGFITACLERVVRRRQPLDPSQASSRGAQIAHELKAGISQAPGRSVRLGTENDLCERFAVSRPVLRHAIRILEDRGLIESQRGRGRGLIIKAPDPRPAMQVANAYFDSVRFTRADLRQAKHDLAALINMLATPKFDMRLHGSDLEAVLAGVGGPNILAPYRLVWTVIDNPVLSLIYRIVLSCNTTLMPERGAARASDIKAIADSCDEWMRALATGDCVASVIAANRRSSLLDQAFN